MHVRANKKAHCERKKFVIWFLVNALAVVHALYGLKCIALRRGMALAPAPDVEDSFVFRPVLGTAAVAAGLAYAGLGVFVYLSANPPPPSLGRCGRVIRGVVRWGSLVAMVLFMDKARRM